MFPCEQPSHFFSEVFISSMWNTFHMDIRDQNFKLQALPCVS
uniref:Uncharacterized protein n=1 Tax=Rhizophora mucronata TaxID=61149 RepID=A0A2P2R4E0_RHIMU